MAAIERKECRRCLQMKTLRHFGLHRRMKDGRTTICSTCVRTAAAQRYRPRVEITADERDPDWGGRGRGRARASSNDLGDSVAPLVRALEEHRLRIEEQALYD